MPTPRTFQTQPLPSEPRGSTQSTISSSSSLREAPRPEAPPPPPLDEFEVQEEHEAQEEQGEEEQTQRRGGRREREELGEGLDEEYDFHRQSTGSASRSSLQLEDEDSEPPDGHDEGGEAAAAGEGRRSSWASLTRASSRHFRRRSSIASAISRGSMASSLLSETRHYLADEHGGSFSRQLSNDPDMEIELSRHLARRLMDVTTSTSDRWYAARQLGEGKPIDAGAGELAAEWVQHRLDGLGVADCMVRLAAVHAVLDMGQETLRARSPDIAPRLLELLGDRFPPIRRCAVQCLRLMGPTAVTEADALTQVALRDSHRDIRLEAVRALGAMGEGAGWQLQKLLASDFWRVRCLAAQALGVLTDWMAADEELSSSVAAHLALVMFEAPPHPAVREEVVEAAADALGCLSERAELQLLRLTMLLRDDESARIRVAAVRALARVATAVASRRHPGHHRFVRVILKEGKRPNSDEVSMTLDELLYIICRVLVATLRDQGLRVRAEFAAEELRDQAEDFKLRARELAEERGLGLDSAALGSHATASAALSSTCDEAEREALNGARAGLSQAKEQLRRCQRIEEQARKLQRAVEDTFSQLGAHALPYLCRHLLGEDGGRLNRMAVMRGLRCAGRLDERFESLFLAEWVLGVLPLPYKSEQSVQGDLSRAESLRRWHDAKTSMPLPRHKVVKISTNQHGDLGWAVLRGERQTVFLVFAALPSSMAFRWAEPEQAELLSLSVDFPQRGSGRVQVHRGLWTILEADWEAIQEALVAAAGKGGRLPKLVICGSGPAGGLALLATVKLLLEEAPLGPVALPRLSQGAEGAPDVPVLPLEKPGSARSHGSGGGQSGDSRGIVAITFGSPHVVARGCEGPHSDLQPALQARCSPRSLSVCVEEDKGGRGWREALCCSRRSSGAVPRWPSRAERAHLQRFGPLFQEEVLSLHQRRHEARFEAAAAGSACAYTDSMVHQLSEQLKANG